MASEKPYHATVFHFPEYADCLYDPSSFAYRLRIACSMLKPHLHKFDSIVLRGTSGTIFGGALSLRIKKKLFVVRKEGENSHASSIISGNGYVNRWLFVDDFICSGSTLRVCRDMFGDEDWVGSYLYCRNELHIGNEIKIYGQDLSASKYRGLNPGA